MGGVSGLPIGSKGYKQQQLNRFRRQQTNNPIVDEYLKRTRNVTPPSAGERQITNPATLEQARRAWGSPQGHDKNLQLGGPYQSFFGRRANEQLPGLNVDRGRFSQANPPGLAQPSVWEWLLGAAGLGGAASQSPEIEEFLNQTKRRQDPIR
jgi:hypothetical protein